LHKCLEVKRKATLKGVAFNLGGGQLALIEQPIQPMSKNWPSKSTTCFKFITQGKKVSQYFFLSGKIKIEEKKMKSTFKKKKYLIIN